MRKLALLMFIFVVFPKVLFGQKPSPLSLNKISLNDFLVLAQKNDPNFDRIIAEKGKIDFLLDQGLPTRQWLLSLQQETGIASGSSENTSVVILSAKKQIIETGTQLSVSRTTTDRPDREEEVSEFRLEQSLWNNFLGRDVRLKKAALSREQEMIKLQVLEAYENYISEIAKTYLEYSQAYINVQLAEKIAAESKVLYDNVVSRKNKSIATQTDVDRAQLQMLLSREDLSKKQTLLESSQQKVSAIINQNRDTQKVTLTPEIDLNLSDRFQMSELTEKLNLPLLRAIQVLASKEDIAEKNRTLEERAAHPELTLVAGYDIDNSRRFTTAVNREETIVGVNVEMPLGDSLQKANIKSASLELNKAQLDRKVLETNLTSRYADLKNQWLKSKQNLDISKQKVFLTERILKEENKRYQRGTLSLENLIETRRDLSEYRYKYYSDLVEHNKIVIDWLNFTDRLTRLSGATIKL